MPSIPTTRLRQFSRCFAGLTCYPWFSSLKHMSVIWITHSCLRRINSSDYPPLLCLIQFIIRGHTNLDSNFFVMSEGWNYLFLFCIFSNFKFGRNEIEHVILLSENVLSAEANICLEPDYTSAILRNPSYLHSISPRICYSSISVNTSQTKDSCLDIST